MTREEIRLRVSGYSEHAEAFRRNFERDKELLREMGLPLVTEPVGGSAGGGDQRNDAPMGYRIPRQLYEMADPGLTEDELAALRLAASVVEMDIGEEPAPTTSALRKLAGLPAAASSARAAPATAGVGGAGVGGAGVGGAGVRGLRASPDVARSFEAIAERKCLRFEYRGQQRQVEPWRLSYRGGHWYLSGWDRTRADERVYRLDRVQGPIALAGPAEHPGRQPRSLPGAPPPPWQLGDDEEAFVDLFVDAVQAPWAISALGEEAVEERGADGSVRLRVRVTNRGAFRSFVLGFLDHAEVLGPPELRRDIVEWLESIAGKRAALVAGSAVAGGDIPGGQGTGGNSSTCTAGKAPR